MKYRPLLWMFLKHKIFKISEGEMLPWYALIIWVILFPIKYLKAKLADSEYDFVTGSRWIYGVKYTDEFFYLIGELSKNQSVVIKKENKKLSVRFITKA